MQSISKYNKGFHRLLCVIDIYSKCSRAVLLEEKKCITITNASQKTLDEFRRKANKILIDKNREF